MKKIILPTAAILLLCLCSSCSTTQYVPVETVKTEYRHTTAKDSIFLRDSIFVREKSDTVYLEKYRYLYCNNTVRDTLLVRDTIRVPYPVEVVKEVKASLTGWQNFQVWCGRILLVLALLAGLYFVLKLKRLLPFKPFTFSLLKNKRAVK